MIHPLSLLITSNTCVLSRLKLIDHSPLWPSVLLKYALALFRPSGTYQLPHRSFATNGKPYASATRHTNSASSEIELRRLEIESVLRLRDARVEEKLVASSGKMRSDVWIGFVIMEMKMLLLSAGSQSCER